ncbi:MAG TPA: glycosyltransferase family 2 protein [Rhizomicrobium sp.]|nr:glycosyltransferase family 2 protein [Rhizomicrobium sp.]
MTPDFGTSLRQTESGCKFPTPEPAKDDVEIDVCICSFRRPEIVETLAALANQNPQAPGFRVIVADNTADGRAREWSLRAAGELGLDLTYVHAPANNISIARNACLDAARGRWIAFIDDDERPVRNWLAALMREAQRGEWAAILGPVIALYPESEPPWLRRGDFHSIGPVWRNNEIGTGYTGNVLFRRDLVERPGSRFRLDLGTTGGEDDDFFDRLRDSGGRIGFAPDAVCYERVGPGRAGMNWLLRRNFRAGQSHGARLRRRGRIPQGILLAVGKAFFCGAGAALTWPDAVRRNHYFVRAALHGGVAARLAGVPEIKMY